MDSSTLSPTIALIGSLLVTSLTFWLTKKKERSAEWRKEKLAYYKAFIESLSGNVEGDATPENHVAFAKATNNLLLFAPQSVIAALNDFRSEISVSNTCRTQEKHDKLLTTLLLAIRMDIGVKPNDNPSTFTPVLWSSGVKHP